MHAGNHTHTHTKAHTHAPRHTRTHGHTHTHSLSLSLSRLSDELWMEVNHATAAPQSMIGLVRKTFKKNELKSIKKAFGECKLGLSFRAAFSGQFMSQISIEFGRTDSKM